MSDRSFLRYEILGLIHYSLGNRSSLQSYASFNLCSAFFRCYPEKMEWECKDNTYRMTGGWQVPEFLRFNRLDNSWLISDLLCDVKNCAGQRISDREMNETKAPRKPLKRNLLEINGFHIHFSFARGFILSFPSLFHFGSEINCLDQLSIVFQLISGRLLPG